MRRKKINFKMVFGFIVAIIALAFLYGVLNINFDLEKLNGFGRCVIGVLAGWYLQGIFNKDSAP